jgi:RimJ/RimL family protein N-acetyltransferase
MITPVWIGRFHVTGPRDNRYLNGYAAAYLWVASQAGDEATLKERVSSALKANGLTVAKEDRLELIQDDAALPFELRKLVRDARRDSDSVACGKFQGFEDHAGRRPMLLEVKTERLLLRPWEPRDRAPFAAMNGDREVMTYLPKILTRAESDNAVDQYLADAHKTGFGFLVAELKAASVLKPGAFAGMMGLRIMRDILPKVQQPAVEIAFRIARPYQRKGLALEGGRALLKLAFHDFQLPEVVAVVPLANTPGRRLLEKLGMTHRKELEFTPPGFPAQHLYARHTLYQIRNPS